MGGVINSGFLFLRLLPLVRSLRREFPFDVIDSHFAYPDGIAAAMLAQVFGCPYVITLRGNETMHSGFRWRGRAIRWAIRRASRIITVSERLREFAIECGARPQNVCTIPNGVDTAVFHPRGTSAVRAGLGLGSDAPLVLSAGYLIERKGHHRVMHALRQLRDSGVPPHLVIAGGPGGEGRYEPVLRALTDELSLTDRVHFTGPVSQQRMAELMSAANVVCLASAREGWPNVVNEALACGSPVVATDVGGVPDMLPSDRYGIVVPVDDAGALERALERSLALRWDREAIAAWGMSRSWELVAGEVLNVLSEAVNEKKSIQR
jgi:glycosyltransferase involved in cell wall biosynthesis